jgi:hypothetical protein
MSGLDLQTSELLECFVPEPVGAAGDWEAVVADAHVGQRRWPMFKTAAVVAASVAVIAAAVLAWPFGGGSGSVVDRALAALGDGPVLHVVLRETTPAWVTVDLATGARHAAYQETETWSDPDRGSHWILRIDGRVVDDSVWERPIKDPLLLAFVNGYRSALEDGRGRAAGEGDVEGVKVHWLEFRSASGGAEEVAVDADSYEPVAIRWVSHEIPAPFTRVLEINTEPAGAGDFTAEQHRPHPSRGDVVQSDVVERSRAQGWLSTPVLWPGPSVAGVEFSVARADEWKVVYPNDEAAPVAGHGIRLAYTAPGDQHPSLRLSEASYPTFAYGWWGVVPAPEPGTIRITAFRAAAGSLGGDMYQGQIVQDGTFVVLQGTSEEQVVAAAKALEPMPSS